MGKVFTKLTIALIVGIFWLTLLTPYVSAQTINASPGSVNYGETTTITLSGLEPKDETYTVRVSFDSCTGGIIGEARITTKSDGSCSTDKRGSGFWKGDLSCSVGGSPSFSGVVDTTKLGLSDKETSDNLFKVCLLWPAAPELLPETSFTVKANSSNAAFKIEFIFNKDGTTNSQTNVTNPGEQIGVRLSGAKSGKYGLKIGNDAIQESNCDNKNCTLYGTIKNDPNTPPSLQVVAADPDGNTQNATVYIKSNISNVVSPTPAPSLTLAPPLPPCYADYTVNGEFTGCASVYTGFGIPISTEPGAFIKSIFTILLSLSGGVAILLIMWSGYKLMASRGDPERVKEGREVLTSAIIGLLFLIFSLVILEIIGVDILHIPGLRH